MTALTKKEIFAHLSDLRNYADKKDHDGFEKLARKIIIPHSPELMELYDYSKEDGYKKKEKLKKNFNRRAEAIEELIRVSYPCFQTCDFKPLFEYLPKMGV